MVIDGRCTHDILSGKGMEKPPALPSPGKKQFVLFCQKLALLCQSFWESEAHVALCMQWKKQEQAAAENRLHDDFPHDPVLMFAPQASSPWPLELCYNFKKLMLQKQRLEVGFLRTTTACPGPSIDKAAPVMGGDQDGMEKRRYNMEQLSHSHSCSFYTWHASIGDSITGYMGAQISYLGRRLKQALVRSTGEIQSIWKSIG